jgi:hypothetical protein
MTLDPRILRGLGPSAVSESAALLARLGKIRVGLSVGHGKCAQAIGRTTADQLARLFPHLVAADTRTERLVGEQIAWAGTDTLCEVGPAELAIIVGDGAKIEAPQSIYVGADGWRVHMSDGGPQPAVRIGLGAPAAGFLATLEVFKRVFRPWIDGDVEEVTELHWSLFDWSTKGDDPGPELARLALPEVVWAGMGAVAHGAFWALSLLPRMSGSFFAVDPDPYGSQAVRRYPAARAAWEGKPKPDQIRDWLGGVNRQLRVISEVTDINSWYSAHRPDCVVPILVTTPDSKETRRHCALKLPRVAISAWAEGFRLGTETFPFRDGRCLGCAYPVDAEAISEIDEISKETNLKPWRVRQLLDAGGPLSDNDIAVIRASYPLDASELRGRTLRSVREHLCAVGRLTIPGNPEGVEVPLGFVSAIAGVVVAAELIRWVLGMPTGKRWAWDARLAPQPGNAWPNGPRDDCFACGDPDFVDAYRAKYS